MFRVWWVVYRLNSPDEMPQCTASGKAEEMNDREIREKSKHKIFTSMAQRRRWLALQEDIEKNKEKKEKSQDDWPNVSHL